MIEGSVETGYTDEFGRELYDKVTYCPKCDGNVI